MPSVIIGLPIMRGQLEPECFHSLLLARKHLYEHRIPHNVLSNESSVISASRNAIVEKMLNTTNAEYLFWLDSDIQFPPYGITRLIDRGKDIIGGVYYHKGQDSLPTVYKLKPEDGRYRTYIDFKTDAPFEVDGIGTGFLLVKRAVFERFTNDVVKEIGTPFGFGHAPDGVEEGEDLSFCRRAKGLGYEVWADPTIPLGHVGKIAYTREHFENAAQFNGWKRDVETYDNEIPGWMTKTELNWLRQTAEKMDSVVEVGSWKGRSTHALLTGCRGEVTAVDHWQGSNGERGGPHVEVKDKDIFMEFWKNVGEFPNLKVFRLPSVEAAERFKDKSVDMVFIDGSHDTASVRADIDAWLPKARKIICGHDFQWHSVQEAVTERWGVPDLADTIWVKRLDESAGLGNNPAEDAAVFLR